MPPSAPAFPTTCWMCAIRGELFGRRVRRDAAVAVREIVARGKLPILAGGTGLYFRALLQGLSPMPEADPTSVRTSAPRRS